MPSALRAGIPGVYRLRQAPLDELRGAFGARLLTIECGDADSVEALLETLGQALGAPSPVRNQDAGVELLSGRSWLSDGGGVVLVLRGGGRLRARDAGLADALAGIVLGAAVNWLRRPEGAPLFVLEEGVR